MHTLQAIITGSIQGLSEFLPVSSSAHIVFSNFLCSHIFNGSQINEYEEIFFDIAVHLGTLFAVVLYFYQDIKEILLKSYKSYKAKDYTAKEFKMLLYIALSVVITGIIGFIFKKPVEYIITNPKFICFFLFLTGLILLASEKMYKGNKKIDLKNTIFISIAQGFAIFPGFSRSGLTISTALFGGVERVEAAKFSFLMSIPVIILASIVYPILELDFSQIASFNLKAIIIGTFVSFVVGYFCIKYFMKLLAKLSLRSFGFYCLVVSVLMFLIFQFFYHL